MVQWIEQHMPDVVVGDLVTNKPNLIDISATTSVVQTLDILNTQGILSGPVYGKKGGWIGAGGVELCIGDKQYIGIVSLIDILAFVFQNEQMVLEKLLSTPISQVLGGTEESVECHEMEFLSLFTLSKSNQILLLCLWVEPANRRLLYACEMLSKGVHRALVTAGSSVRLLTQTDVVKFIVTHSRALPHLSDLFSKPVRDVAQAARSGTKDGVLYVELQDRLEMAVSMLLEHKITALPVLDHDGILKTQLSISDFRNVFSTTIATLRFLTVEQYLLGAYSELRSPITCRDTDSVGYAVQTMLSSRVHRIWIIPEKRQLSLLTFTDVIAAAIQSEP